MMTACYRLIITTSQYHPPLENRAVSGEYTDHRDLQLHHRHHRDAPGAGHEGVLQKVESELHLKVRNHEEGPY